MDAILLPPTISSREGPGTCSGEVMDTQRLLVAEARAAHPSPVEAREASLVDLSRDTPSLDPVEARVAPTVPRAAEARVAPTVPRDPRVAPMAPRGPRVAHLSALRAATPPTTLATLCNMSPAPVQPTVLRVLLPRDLLPRVPSPSLDQVEARDPAVSPSLEDPNREDPNREDQRAEMPLQVEDPRAEMLLQVVTNGAPMDTTVT